MLLTIDGFISKLYLEMINHFGNQYLNGIILDVGCGDKPYEKLLKNHEKYIGLDYDGAHYPDKIDIIASADSIPLLDGSVDSVLCTQLLEHMENPDLVISEIKRILKPGGYAVISVPFIWNIHMEPRDFFRFSKFGLEYLMKKNNLNIISIQELGGFWITWLQLLANYIQIPTVNHPNFLIRKIIVLPITILNIIMYIIYKLKKPGQLSRRFTANYFIIAQN
jgi:SAM-dependent methyltransferase